MSGLVVEGVCEVANGAARKCAAQCDAAADPTRERCEKQASDQRVAQGVAQVFMKSKRSQHAPELAIEDLEGIRTAQTVNNRGIRAAREHDVRDEECHRNAICDRKVHRSLRFGQKSFGRSGARLILVDPKRNGFARADDIILGHKHLIARVDTRNLTGDPLGG